MGISASPSSAQVDYVLVRNLIIKGNKHTERKVILREMDIFPSDTLYLDKLPEQILKNEKRLLSTALFTDVNINLRNWDIETNWTDVEVTLQENWYIYPSFIFELADRNFNVWWQEMNRSLDRVNYGLRLDHINLTGYRDRLKLKAQLGYTRKFEVKYDYPLLSKNWGIEGSVFYSDNKEIGFRTIGNKTEFRKTEDERKLLFRRRLGASLLYRPGLFAFHAFRFQYHHNTIDTIVAHEWNPEYFLNGETDLRFFLLEYDFNYDKRIFFQYPEGGYRIFFNAKKEGLGIFGQYNNLPISGGIEWHNKHKRFIISNRIKGKTSPIRDQVAFANNSGLGYGADVVTGYELYVLDGLDYFIWQFSLKYRLIDTVKDLGDAMPMRQFRRMSIKVFLRANYSMGYAHEPTYTRTNVLNNQWAAGYGPALDIILWNIFTMRAEYSFNELGEGGFFLKGGAVF